MAVENDATTLCRMKFLWIRRDTSALHAVVVVGLGLRLGLDLWSGWLVVMHTYLYYFLLSLSHPSSTNECWKATTTATTFETASCFFRVGWIDWLFCMWMCRREVLLELADIECQIDRSIEMCNLRWELNQIVLW